ncbi:SusC/RagA family TonB-linked outer membrane protein [Allomuricauda sp. SCSIO 65647]|uniref:SusC/RagA family TonB-linked outer membrane protein n=1 Tax=Allomuricauda sp. SCSIO 65647 TaxID=2908843 RepID=UPI001F2FCD3C|nr:SusC/RagA family TonB-linked outer membrane protein [Muricauda sp. SCSIO 65647]UJH66246.1 SusC/RagA family TonB-linked outer membrane protein [Muricauda sp. SCSIO 65647]
MKKLQRYLILLLLAIPLWGFSQVTVTGVVTDVATGLPIPGANIIIKGTTTGTVTDFDGNYTLTANQGDVLVFSYIGFNTQEIAVTTNQLDVALQESTEQLDEVVVIGYGTTTVKDATGSVDLVTAEDFNQGVIVSADQLLVGKAPGIRITNNGGAPDSEPNIRIRSGASLSANSSPLIVIDGIPIDSRNAAGVSNPLNLINPNDIESFSVLKDASASAIYGSRASNGVIIITTKKGTSGEARFNFSSNVSFAGVTDQIDLLNGDEYIDFIDIYSDQLSRLDPNAATRLGVPVGSVSTSEPSRIITVTDENGNQIQREVFNTDWQDAIYRTAITANSDFSVRANLFNKIPFRASLGYSDIQGVVRTNDLERVTGSIKLTPMLFDDHLKIDINAKGIYTEKNAVDEEGALGNIVRYDPTKPVFDANSPFGGFYNLVSDGSAGVAGTLLGGSNPLALLNQRSRPEINRRLLANIEFDYKMHFFPELRAVLNLGTEASRARIEERFTENAISTYRQDNVNGGFVFNPGVNYEENQHITNVTSDAYLVYTKTLDNSFLRNFDVQGGYAYQNFKNDGNKVQYRYNVDTGLREVEPNPGNPNRRFYNEWNLQSFFGRANLNFFDKYLLTLSYRRDGSSLFLEDKRWGNFPAAALAWKVNEESFLEDVSFVKVLKLRLGWGQTGQSDIVDIDGVGFYPALPLFDIGGGTSQYLDGVNIYSARPFNPDLTWETTTTYNAGIDFTFFNRGQLSGSFDVFMRETEDLLVQAPVAPGQGFTNLFPQNIGSTEGEGFELSLEVAPVQSEDFYVSLNGNLAYSRTEVTDLEGLESIEAGESTIPFGTGVRLARHAVGEQVYSAWVFRQVYDDTGRPILGSFVDLNGDGQITNADRYYKALRPNWTFGFGLNVNYKNLDLAASFRGQLDGQIYNARRLTSGFIEAAIPTDAQSLTNVLDFFSGAADDRILDRLNNVQFSDYYLESAAFLRCENITLGYTFKEILEDANLKIFAAVNNAFLITDYDGQDPENFNAIDNNFYPRPRTFSLGVNFDF